MGKLQIAIIGCGNIFPVHADAVVESKLAELNTVVDIVPEKAAEMAKKYKCKFKLDYHDLLTDKEIDVVHICTPHYLHHSMALDLMQAGKDLLVEKPLAIGVKEARLMIETAEKERRRLGVVFQNRYNESSLRAKEIIEKGEMGSIQGIRGIVTWKRDADYYNSADWRGKWSTEGGGVLINQAIHTLDLMQWFAGDVESIGGNVNTRLLQDSIEVEDTADATIFFESGAIGIFYATNCFSTNSPVEIEIDCEQGKINICGDNLTIEYKTSKNEKQKNFVDPGVSEYTSYWGNGHQRLIEDYYQDIIKNRFKNTITGKEGLKALKMIDGIYKSSMIKRKISI